MLQKIFENQYLQYIIVGLSVLTILALLMYFAPFVVMGVFALGIVCMMSFAIGYVIVDSYSMWREDNDKNKSGKKASPRKNVE